MKTNLGNINRRDLLRNMALIGVGGIAATTLQSSTVTHASKVSDFHNESVSGEQTKLTVKEIYAKAREALYPDCRVCPQCDGIACSGEYNMGGVGSSMSFRNNFTALQRICLKMRTLVDDPELEKEPDTTTTIFGQKLSFPAMAAPIGPFVLKLGKGIEKDRYYDAIIGGCVDAGVVGAIGDNVTLPIAEFKQHCGYISAVNGRSLIGLKPRPAQQMIPLLPYIEEAGTFMIDIDTDTGGRFPVSELRKIIQSTKLPVVVKGVMTIDDAKRAADAGAAGIVVSNHGGRRLDFTPGTADVLPAIADAMKGELVIMADGCVRYGADVLKYLALGADVVLVGRHIVRAAFGSGRDGVALFMNNMKNELAVAMSMTAVSSIKKINRDILA